MALEHQGRDPHEHWRELCALATSGDLSRQERSLLDAHLAECRGCRKLCEQYAAVWKDGMPLLAADVNFEEDGAALQWENGPARLRLLAAVDLPEEPAPARRPASRGWRASGRGAWIAAAACLLLSAGMGGYWTGRESRGPAQSILDSLRRKVQQADAERALLNSAATERARQESQLAAQNDRSLREADQLREQLRNIDQRWQELAASVAGKDAQLDGLKRQRDALEAKLQDADRRLHDANAKVEQLKDATQERDSLLAQLRGLEERSRSAQTDLARLTDQLRAKNAEAQELSARLAEQRRETERSVQYLAADRDIRELMGARQLYIADVFDVGGDGRTRKPYGRVFYTQSKSLIFYAFDLDRQPGVRGDSTFQVWGHKESTHGESPRPVSLGVLYLDSESNRRWVLKSNDAEQLAAIDALFVTVEPHGGAYKPTGKPFLYAFLRKAANHP